MSLNLRQIEVFRAVMSTGSISGAAGLLHVSQPAVSRLLSYTENRIGFSLFERIKGRLYATPEAKRMVREVDVVYLAVQRVNELAHDLAEQRRGFLHVVSSASIGQLLVPQALAVFREHHADVRVTFSVLNFGQMKEKLLNQRCDLGIVILPMEHPNLDVTPLAQGRIVCICPRGHALARRKVLQLADLRPFQLIGYDLGTPFGSVINGMYAAAGEPLTSTIEVGSPQNACALVQMGAGIALVDEFSVRSWPTEQFVVREVVGAPALAVNIVHPRFEPLSQLAQSFIDELRRLMVLQGYAPSEATVMSPRPAASAAAAAIAG